ncbi:MAG TPA: hypothetical protein VGZ00_09245 [Candidatus Baltobacteraceae bacterium]|nr:hypothetical protein [Candidatus Baltobacteraceae bacterium]
MPQPVEVETITKLIFSTPTGGDTIKGGQVQTYGPVDIDRFDRVRVSVKHHPQLPPNIAIQIRPETTQGTTQIPLTPLIPNLVAGASDSVVYPVPGEKLTIVVTGIGLTTHTGTYDLLVYGSR